MIATNRTMRLHDHCMRVCGANLAERINSALLFKQAMACGVLRGDEFRAMLENNPYCAGFIARHFGVTIGNLRNLSREGRITSELVALILRKNQTMIVSDSECVPTSFEERAAKEMAWAAGDSAKLRERLIEIIGDDQGL